MEMNGNKICDADLSVQMLNDKPMHLKLKKRRHSSRQNLSRTRLNRLSSSSTAMSALIEAHR